MCPRCLANRKGKGSGGEGRSGLIRMCLAANGVVELLLSRDAEVAAGAEDNAL